MAPDYLIRGSPWLHALASSPSPLVCVVRAPASTLHGEYMTDVVAEGILKFWFRSRLLELAGFVRVEGHGYHTDELQETAIGHESRLRNSRNYCKGGDEVVKKTSRRAVKSEDSYVFGILLPLVDGLGSTRQVRNPSAHCVKSKQFAIGKSCVRDV